MTDLILPPGVEFVSSGKSRDCYFDPDFPDELIFVTANRFSVFDVRSADQFIQGKGEALNAISAFFVRATPVIQVAPNDLVSTEVLPRWAEQVRGRVARKRKAVMLAFEGIVRGYLLGSAWKEYKTKGTVHGQPMPPGMYEGQAFDEPIFTPSTKAPEGEHDINISFEELVLVLGDRGIAERAREICLEAYKRGAAWALERGIILLDTKFELGWIDGEIAICDEVLTPESSRYTRVSDYVPGQPIISMDKQRIRDYVEMLGWDKEPPMPYILDEVLQATSQDYQDVVRIVTGPPLAA